jgi:hypothetical protein
MIKQQIMVMTDAAAEQEERVGRMCDAFLKRIDVLGNINGRQLSVPQCHIAMSACDFFSAISFGFTFSLFIDQSLSLWRRLN